MEKKKGYQPTALRLLRWLVEDKTWDLLSDNGFTDSDFKGNGKEALDFIREYFGEYSEFPTQEVVEEETKIKFPKETARGYAIKAFKRHLKIKHISKLNEKSLDFLAKSDPDSAQEVLITGLAEISQTEAAESFKEAAQERFDEYVAGKLTGLNGIIPPYPSLAAALRVWEYSTHNVALGITGAGKSYMCCQAALFAAYGDQKAKVLFASMENSAKSITNRLDAMYHKIPFGDILSKQVDMRQEKGWKENVPNLERETGDILVVDETTIRTVGDIYQIYLTEKPDFIIIDGAYRLSTSANASGFDNTTNVLNELHHFAALSTAAWLSTSQLDGKAMEAGAGRERAFKARFSQRFLMDPATVFCLYNTVEDLIMNICTFEIAKIRDAGDLQNVKMVFKVNADRQTMDYGELLEPYFDQDVYDDLV